MTQKEFIQKWSDRDLLVLTGETEVVDEYYVMLDEDTPPETRAEFWHDWTEVWKNTGRVPGD